MHEWTLPNQVNFMKIGSKLQPVSCVLIHTYINKYISTRWSSYNASMPQTTALHEYTHTCAKPMVHACGVYVFKMVQKVMAVSAMCMLMKMSVAALKKTL